MAFVVARPPARASKWGVRMRAPPVAGLGQGARAGVAGGACGDAAGSDRGRAVKLGCPAGGTRMGAWSGGAAAVDGAPSSRVLGWRRSTLETLVGLFVSVPTWGGFHFDYDGRFLCCGFGMGTCNDLSPTISAEFMYLERLGPIFQLGAEIPLRSLNSLLSSWLRLL